MGTILPSVFLSGYVFPLDSMPWPLMHFSNLLPTTWMIDASRSVILRGGGWNELWRHAAILWAMSAGSLIFSTLRLQKRV
jgi:ABC-2 type transport system permease protein